MDAFEIGVLADELRRVRKNPPKTIGEASKAYADALERAKVRGVDQVARLLFGEMLWLVLRPMEEKDVVDEIGAALDEVWTRRDRDLKLRASSLRPRT